MISLGLPCDPNTRTQVNHTHPDRAERMNCKHKVIKGGRVCRNDTKPSRCKAPHSPQTSVLDFCSILLHLILNTIIIIIFLRILSSTGKHRNQWVMNYLKCNSIAHTYMYRYTNPHIYIHKYKYIHTSRFLYIHLHPQKQPSTQTSPAESANNSSILRVHRQCR